MTENTCHHHRTNGGFHRNVVTSKRGMIGYRLRVMIPWKWNLVADNSQTQTKLLVMSCSWRNFSMIAMIAILHSLKMKISKTIMNTSKPKTNLVICPLIISN